MDLLCFWTTKVIPRSCLRCLCFCRSYEICDRPEKFVGGRVWLSHPQDDSCIRPVQFGSFLGNPPIQFDGVQDARVLPRLEVTLPENSVRPMQVGYFATKVPSTQRLLTTQPLTGLTCSLLNSTRGGGATPIVFGRYKSEYWIHDPRFVLLENTLSNPLADGGGVVVEQTTSDILQYQALCANVPRSWQNEASCYLSQDPQVCGPSSGQQPLDITLNEDTLALFYNLTSSNGPESVRYVFAMAGLRITDDAEVPPPCQPLAKSRWIPVSGSTKQDCQTLGTETSQVLGNLIANHGDETDFLRDVFFPAHSSAVCDEADVKAKDFEVWVDGTCWHNVHPNHGQVYDMTDWLDQYPGGAENIAPFAGSAWLSFPSNHDMQEWQEYNDLIPNLGRFGDTVDFHSDLNVGIQFTPSIRQHFLPHEDKNVSSPLTTTGQLKRGVVVCGSPGEVANDLQLDGDRLRGAFGIATTGNSTGRTFKVDMETIWTTVATMSGDQLRQRMAWALSQILVCVALASGEMVMGPFSPAILVFVVLTLSRFLLRSNRLLTLYPIETRVLRLLSNTMTFLCDMLLGIIEPC